MKKPFLISSPVKPSDDSSPSCYLTTLQERPPSENLYLAKLDQSTELKKMTIHFCFKPLGLGVVCYVPIDNWRTIIFLWPSFFPSLFTYPHVLPGWSLSNFRPQPMSRSSFPTLNKYPGFQPTLNIITLSHILCSLPSISHNWVILFLGISSLISLNTESVKSETMTTLTSSSS